MTWEWTASCAKMHFITSHLKSIFMKKRKKEKAEGGIQAVCACGECVNAHARNGELEWGEKGAWAYMGVCGGGGWRRGVICENNIRLFRQNELSYCIQPWNNLTRHFKPSALSIRPLIYQISPCTKRSVHDSLLKPRVAWRGHHDFIHMHISYNPVVMQCARRWSNCCCFISIKNENC